MPQPTVSCLPTNGLNFRSSFSAKLHISISDKLRPLYDDKSYIAFSKPTFLEIMNINASKSNCAKSSDFRM